MKDVLKWLVKESNYVYMYGAIISFIILTYLGGAMVGVYAGLFVLCIASVGVYVHYKKLEKLGKWDKKDK